MAKPKKFRVAVAGETIDGRTIEPQWLRDAVDTFNPATYGVRANVEHIRGLSGDKPFGAVGDVVGLSAQEDELTIAGKVEKRVSLYAEVLPNERAIELNKADQKVYTSIELLPNFCGSNKWGLVGLALTDTPASIGTERLQFSKAIGALTVNGSEEVKFDADAAANAFSQLGELLTNLTAKLAGGEQKKPAEQTVIVPPQQNASPDQFAAFAGEVVTGMKALNLAMQESTKAANDGLAELRRDFNTLKTSLESTPSNSFTRAPATGSDGNGKKEELSDF